MKNILQFTAAVLVVLIASSAHAQIRTGTIQCNVEDLLNMKQGTIEFWFRTPIDVQEYLPSTEKYVGLLSLFQLETSTGTMGVTWFAGASSRPKAAIYLSIASQRIELHPSHIDRFMPKPNDWHHFAMAWKGDQMNFYLDGKQTASKTFLEPLHLAMGTVGQTPIRFGDKWHRKGLFDLDELRFSSIQRTPEELGYHSQLRVDPYTTLLDRFDSPLTIDGTAATQPVWSITGESFVPSKNCRIVEGRLGNAISFYPHDEEDKATATGSSPK